MFFLKERKIKKALLNEARQITPQYWNKISGETDTSMFTKKKMHFRPILVAMCTVFIITISITAYATVNSDIRDYIAKFFSSNPGSVNGNIINKSVEQEGIRLDVDAALVENNGVILFYKLTDKTKHIFESKATFNECYLKFNGVRNFARNLGKINNGEQNFGIFNFEATDALKNKNSKLEFVVESIGLREQSKQHILSLDTKDYDLDKDLNIKINSIEFSNSCVSLSIKKPHGYTLLKPIIRNKKTKEEYFAIGQSIHDTDNKDQGIYNYAFGPLDSNNKDDYELVLDIPKLFTFKEPLKVEFDLDFSNKPKKILKPQKTVVESASVEEIDIYQMSLMVKLNDSETQNSLSKDSLYGKQRISVKYNDGTTLKEISETMSSPSQNDGRFNYCAMFDSTIDYSREPILIIGNTSIPLYERK